MVKKNSKESQNLSFRRVGVGLTLLVLAIAYQCLGEIETFLLISLASSLGLLGIGWLVTVNHER